AALEVAEPEIDEIQKGRPNLIGMRFTKVVVSFERGFEGAGMAGMRYEWGQRLQGVFGMDRRHGRNPQGDSREERLRSCARAGSADRYGSRKGKERPAFPLRRCKCEGDADDEDEKKTGDRY